MKNINNQVKQGEKVEVMALFNYSRIPCQPLYFRKAGEGEVEITEGVIAAKRHIHLTPADAEEMGVEDKEIVSVKFDGEGRSVAGKLSCQLEFDTASLAWTLIEG